MRPIGSGIRLAQAARLRPGEPASEPPPPPAEAGPPGRLLDLTNWKLTLPIGTAKSPTEILPPKLAAYTHPDYFYVPAGGGRVVLRAPCNAPTTSGSKNPRCELREMRPDGALAGWSTTSGTHTMLTTLTVDELPVHKPQVVINQIHDDDDDIWVAMCNGFRPSAGRIATTGRSPIPCTITFRDGDTEQPQPLLEDYVLGTRLTIMVQVSAGKIRFWADHGDRITPAATGLVITRKATGCYFKAGAYTQSNPSNAGKTVPSGSCAGGENLTTPTAGKATGGDTGTATGQVSFERLVVIHATT